MHPLGTSLVLWPQCAWIYEAVLHEAATGIILVLPWTEQGHLRARVELDRSRSPAGNELVGLLGRGACYGCDEWKTSLVYGPWMTLVCRGLILDLDLPYRGFWVHFIVSEVARFMDLDGTPRAPPRSGISSTFTGPLREFSPLFGLPRPMMSSL
jgi:hypothetical protein